MSSKTRKSVILIVENPEVQPSDCVQKKKGGKHVPFLGGGAFHFGALGCHQNAKATRLNHQTPCIILPCLPLLHRVFLFLCFSI